MSLLVTDAIVLHAFDYLESSRIIRLLTRDAGVQSALARGARKSRGRYGTALARFAEGSAEVHVRSAARPVRGGQRAHLCQAEPGAAQPRRLRDLALAR